MLKDEARVLNAQERKKDFEEKEVAKKSRKEEKKEKRKLEEDQFQFATKEQRKIHSILIQNPPSLIPAAQATANIPTQHQFSTRSSSSSSGPQPMAVSNGSGKRKAEDYPEGEQARISEVCDEIEEEEEEEEAEDKA